MADFEGIARQGAVSFVINDVAYVGAGITNTGNSTVAKRVGDFWSYDPKDNNWDAVTSLPAGAERGYGVGFSVGTKGYVGLGTSDGVTPLNDFYEYDTATKVWRKVADFPGSARWGAVAFTVNGKGYVGCGTDGSNEYNDFYQYTPDASGTGLGAWTKVSSINTKRQFPFVFVINNIAYVGGGFQNSSVDRSFYKFDATTNTWTRLISLNPDNDPEESTDIKNNDDYNYNITRKAAAAFAFNGYGYVSTGNNGAALNTTWQYDPSRDIWVQVDTFQGTSRENAIGFAIGNYGYITTGSTGASRLYDTWRYDPTTEDDD